MIYNDKDGVRLTCKADEAWNC